MKNFRLRKLSALALLSLLAACASAPERQVPPGKLHVINMTQYNKDLTPKIAPDEIYIVKREVTAKLVAGQVAANVIMLALGGGGFGFQGFYKEDLKGLPIETNGTRENLVNLVGTTLPQFVKTQIDEHIQQHSELQIKTFKKNVYVAGSTRLIYDSLMDGEEERFRLVTTMGISKPLEEQGFFNANKSTFVDCKNQSDPPLPIEDWAKDDFLPIKEALERMLTECETKFVAELPNFFKD